MRVSIQKIKPNPFRARLGPLSENQIKRLIESYKMSDFGKNQRFEVRQKQRDYQLVYGHHRLEALKRLFGKKIEAEIVIHNYDDKMMLQELLRENLTQEDRWFSRMKAIMLAKKFLKTQGKPISDVAITKFLSRDEKTVSRSDTNTYLSIAENFDPELLKEITFGRVKDKVHRLSIKQAYYLSRFPDYAEQKDLAKALKNCHIQNHVEQAEFLRIYRSLNPSEKGLVRAGKVNLALVPNLIREKEMKKIQEFKSRMDKTRSKLKRSRIASQLYANLLDLQEVLKKSQNIKFRPEISEIFSGLYKEIARELLRQSKILMIERR